MECFAHEGKAAVAVCKNCAKGVCRHCAIPVTNGLACSAACAPFAESVAQLQLATVRNTGLYRAQRNAQLLMAGGLVAVGVGLAYNYPRDYSGWTFLTLGSLFAVLILRAGRMKK